MVDFRLENSGGGTTLTLLGDLVIENGEQLKNILVEAAKGRDRLFLDISKITAVDAAGFQLLWAASRTAEYSSQGPDLFKGLPEGLKQQATDAGYIQPDDSMGQIRTGNVFKGGGIDDQDNHDG